MIEHAIGRNKIPGVSIALVDDQRVVWSQGFGFADLAAQRPATADTLYRVGSISKLFTDTAALQLVEKGKLSLDERVQARLPGFAPRSLHNLAPLDITPRLLMTHHAGLQRDVARAFQSDAPQRFTEMTASFDSYLAYQPGQKMSYSNIGLTVLGSLVERVSGTPFEQHVQRSVLDPLGMAHSAFDMAASKDAAMSKSYNGRDNLPTVALRDVPAGGLNSSVNDLSRFMEMVFAGGQSNGQQVLNPETVAAMFLPQHGAVKLDFDSQIGLGWFLQLPDKASIRGGGVVAGHGGAIDGYRSYMGLLPEHKLGVVVLTNSTTGTEASQHIVEVVLRLALEAKTGTRAPNGSVGDAQLAGTELPFVDKPLAPDVVQQWVGDYTTMMGYVCISSKDGKTLQADAMGHTLAVRERADGSMGLSYKLLGIVPVNLGRLGAMVLSRRTVEGREVLVARNGLREALAGERIHADPAMDAPTRRFIDQHLGRYELLDTGDGKIEVTSVRLLEENGLVIAEVAVAQDKQTLRVVLKPVGNGLAIALGALADQGEIVETLSDEKGHVDVRALGLTFRKVGQGGG
nr:serine hydrolase domain-containing protein [Rhodoferax sp.]